jgi:hypothetical protein
MSVEYIKQTEQGRICTHPKVTKYYEWGGGALKGPIYHYSSIELMDGTKRDFKVEATVYHDAIEECNNFLNTIPE